MFGDTLRSSMETVSDRVTWTTSPQPVEKSRWRFPPPSEWPDQDLVAAGADLEVSTLVDAYGRGLFPMLVSGMPGVKCICSTIGAG